ncbi:ganglioside-induced differentiation-associated protein 1-like [Haliotis rubra]|uniref:ganglioside-induced differentiation-associated protein 1-like n=1 Tax=Haliotis rubra TaxID=36100 RepID=UPI001EE60ADA|nr:ganglioside-induced differentiation-associated protein 1-like [Haliotis rubra]
MAVEPKYTLYQFPMSYYSQKVLLTFFEKKIDFKPVFVNLMANEQLQEWFYRLHPNGLVPLLQFDDKLLPESDDIIDHLDKQTTETCLVPSVDTDVGKDVARWRSLLTTEVPIELITFGLFYNPEMSVTGINAPIKLTKDDMRERSAEAAKALMALAEKMPDVKDNIERKLKGMEKRKDLITDTEKVAAKIDELQAVFDKVEQKLKESGGGAWLCGNDYSAADITLTVLMNRLVLLGILPLFLKETRPLVAAYWGRAEARGCMKQLKEFGFKSAQEQAAKQPK